MTVGELKKELEKWPDHYVVLTEGCDCVGSVGSVSLEREDSNALDKYLGRKPYVGSIMLNRGSI